MKKFSVIILVCISLLACGGGKKPFEKHFGKVFGKEQFRGIQIGDSYNKVLKAENDKFMLFPDSALLKYRYAVTDSEEYHWSYIFADDKVKLILFDAYLGQESDGARYSNMIYKKYTALWGEPVQKDNISTWNKDGITADLINESEIVMMGKVKFCIYASGDTAVKKYIPEL